jgi:hypothetical protein
MDNASGRSIEELMRLAGRKVRIVPKLSVADGIAAARTLFPLCWFDGTDALSAVPQSIPETCHGTVARLDPVCRDCSESTTGPRPENPTRAWIEGLLASGALTARPWLDGLLSVDAKHNHRASGGAFS